MLPRSSKIVPTGHPKTRKCSQNTIVVLIFTSQPFKQRSPPGLPKMSKIAPQLASRWRPKLYVGPCWRHFGSILAPSWPKRTYDDVPRPSQDITRSPQDVPTPRQDDPSCPKATKSMLLEGSGEGFLRDACENRVGGTGRKAIKYVLGIITHMMDIVYI